jgi:pyrroline-5-carboxylate reductase
MKICFIGGGNMATALSGGLIARGTRPESISIVEPRPEARSQLEASFGVMTYAGCEGATTAAEVIVLAVKPQKMREAMADLRAHIGGQLVISIAAGIRLADISQMLGGHQRISRTMPNVAALIGEGISGLYAPPEVGAEDRRTIETIMAAVGGTIWVEHEAMIDAVTAVSGSGPAYVFYFMEALESAAVTLGFNPADARKLALATFRGAALLAAGSSDPPAVLRERVTSKGGTTEAALAALRQAGVADTIAAAVSAANRRGRELGEVRGEVPGPQSASDKNPSGSKN